MSVLSAFLFFFCLLALLIGLIKPSWVVRWGEHRTRRAALLYYGLSAVLFLIIGVATVETPPDKKDVVAHKEAPVEKKDANIQADSLWEAGKHQEAALEYEKILDDLDPPAKGKAVSRALDAVCRAIDKQRNQKPGDPIVIERLNFFGDDPKQTPEEQRAEKLAKLAIKDGLTLTLNNKRAQKTYDWYLNAPERAKAAAAQELINTYLDFEERVMSLAREADSNGEKVRLVAGAMENGQASVVQLYQIVKQAKNSCINVVTDTYSKIEPFEDKLPDKIWEACSEVKDEIVQTYGLKRSGYAYLLDWLDEQKPSQLNEYKEYMRLADTELTKTLFLLDKAREQVGLPSVISLFASKEFQAWRKFDKAKTALNRAAEKKFGLHPHLALEPGQTLKLEKELLILPSPGQRVREANFKGANLVESAVKLKPGDTVNIKKQIKNSKGLTEYYRVGNFDQTGRQGYIWGVVLTWYDTMERIQNHSQKMSEWKKPELEKLKNKYFKTDGLDYDQVFKTALNEHWDRSWVSLGQ